MVGEPCVPVPDGACNFAPDIPKNEPEKQNLPGKQSLIHGPACYCVRDAQRRNPNDHHNFHRCLQEMKDTEIPVGMVSREGKHWSGITPWGYSRLIQRQSTSAESIWISILGMCRTHLLDARKPHINRIWSRTSREPGNSTQKRRKNHHLKSDGRSVLIHAKDRPRKVYNRRPESGRRKLSLRIRKSRLDIDNP